LEIVIDRENEADYEPAMTPQVIIEEQEMPPELAHIFA
jgi:hypothetical protein